MHSHGRGTTAGSEEMETSSCGAAITRDSFLLVKSLLVSANRDRGKSSLHRLGKLMDMRASIRIRRSRAVSCIISSEGWRFFRDFFFFFFGLLVYLRYFWGRKETFAKEESFDAKIESRDSLDGGRGGRKSSAVSRGGTRILS